MKFLIAGLGNPGPEYRNTRHNIGFNVVDALAGASTAFSADRHADRAEFRHRGRTLVLIKPQTFMNLSGKALRYWMEKENIAAERVLVVADDLALPFGKIRLRAGGGAGGHNGLAHIIECLGHERFARLRFGIGRDFLPGAQVDHVLGTWSEDECEALPARVNRAVEAIKDFALMGIDHAMSTFNRD